MSPIGKFFLVLNLVLAALFVGVAASLIGTADSYRVKYESAQQECQAQLEAKDQEIGDLSARLTASEAERSRLITENDNLKAEKTALSESLETERQRNAELTERLTGIEAKLGDLESTNRDLAQQLESSQRQVAQLREERDAALDARDAAQSEATQAREEAKIALGKAGDLELQLSRLQANYDECEAKLGQVVALTGFDLESINAQPMMEGVVLSADVVDGEPIVILNLGKQDGVQPGFTFDVYRGGDYKGRIRVETVNDTKSAATLILEGTAPIEAGDHVTTRL